MDGLEVEDDSLEAQTQIQDVSCDSVLQEETHIPAPLQENIPRPSSAPLLGDWSKAPGDKQDPRKDVFSINVDPLKQAPQQFLKML